MVIIIFREGTGSIDLRSPGAEVLTSRRVTLMPFALPRIGGGGGITLVDGGILGSYAAGSLIGLQLSTCSTTHACTWRSRGPGLPVQVKRALFAEAFDDGRACPCERPPLMCVHVSGSAWRATSAGSARSRMSGTPAVLALTPDASAKAAPRRQGLPLQRMSHANVCARQQFCSVGHICGQRPITDAGYPSSPCIDP